MSCEVKRLHEDEDVQKTKGIYEYLLSKELDPFAGRLLNLRTFEKRDKMANAHFCGYFLCDNVGV